MLWQILLKFIMAVIIGLIAAILLYGAVILRVKILPYQGLFGFNFAAAFVIAVKLIWAAIVGLLFALTYFSFPNDSGKFSTAAVCSAFLFVAIDLWMFVAAIFDSEQKLTKSDFLSNLIDLITTGVVFAAVFFITKFIKAKLFPNL